MTTEALTSIHGNRMGISKDGQLVMQNPVTGQSYAVTPVPEADISSSNLATLVGAVASVTGLACVIEKHGNIATLNFTFTNVAVPHTDAGAGGASGSLKIFDFAQTALIPIGSRSNFTFATDTTMDTAGDMVMIYGFGTAAANAGDKALTGTEVDFSAVSGDITFASNAATSASLLKGAASPLDGTGTALDLYFNESASAATSDANGTLTVNGTYQLTVLLLGDD